MYVQVAGLLSLISVVSAANFNITVGGAGPPFFFSPNNITGVNNGDVVTFTFSTGNHTVSQAAFAKPCEQLPNGFDSDFVNVPANFTGPAPTWDLTISDASKPIWFYCKQSVPKDHCIGGMVGSINAVTDPSGNTIDKFIAAAKNLTTPPAQTPGSLNGTGASATSKPSPVPAATAPANGNTTSGGGNNTAGSNNKNGAASIATSVVVSFMGGVVGIALV